MEISKQFSHTEAESKWYQLWESQGYFNSIPDKRPPYTIVIPPPNVTGVLHMGHALNNTVQDILIRRAKMQGYNTCWVPGTDHASIATEAKVVAMLREQGIDKNTLDRDTFLKYAWEWKEKYGGIILHQFRKLGLSLDWQRTAFTMDPDYYAAVIRVFVELYNKGYIYRDVKMINWDPKAKTALSDEEVIYKQTESKLYYIRYKVENEDEYVTIATVRPETIMGDTAICVHPEDPRYAHLRGKYCLVPLINRRIPVIFDEYIDMEFGTGALKVTPAHDINDYNLGKKHRLEVIDVFNDDGTMSEAATLYVGEDRFVVREKIVVDLEAAGNLVKTENYQNQVGHSERTDVVIEPRLSMQWWCNMKDMAAPALKVVMQDEVKFYPAKFKNLYRHWMENIRDWCVSRQLWWGQRIPAWYDKAGNIYVAHTAEEAKQQYLEKNPGGTDTLRQDEDVLDTWFSSWIWPLEVFGWNQSPQNPNLQYYYPTSTLVTAPEIIFFWVARMIMAGMEFKGTIPFQKVYFTGIVRDKQGRKMSKSLGNSPDLLKLIDDYGTDAVRFSVMIASPAGNDLLYDEAMLEQGRNFAHKMWNALRLVKGWEGRCETAPASESMQFAISWMQNRIAKAYQESEELFKDFRLSEVLKMYYSLIWDDFCSWYLEWVKPAIGSTMSQEVYEATVKIFEDLMQLLHPFMPFVTEEIYHLLREREKGDDLMVKQYAISSSVDELILQEAQILQELITSIRDIRNKNGLKPKDPIELYVSTSQPERYRKALDILIRQTHATALKFTQEPVASSITFVVRSDKFYLVAQATSGNLDQQKEALEKELQYQKGFLESVRKKLNNERFMENAKPEIIANEQKKEQDALSKIKSLEESLRLL